MEVRLNLFNYKLQNLIFRKFHTPQIGGKNRKSKSKSGDTARNGLRDPPSIRYEKLLAWKIYALLVILPLQLPDITSNHHSCGLTFITLNQPLPTPLHSPLSNSPLRSTPLLVRGNFAEERGRVERRGAHLPNAAHQND